MRCFNQLRPAMFAVSAILLIPGCMTAPGYMSPVGTLPGNGYPVGWGPTTGSVPFVPVNGPGGGYPVTGYIPPGTVPSSPFVPISNPTTPTKPVTPANPDNPSIVVGSPPKPTTPSDPSPPSATPTDPASFWTPWPCRLATDQQQSHAIDWPDCREVLRKTAVPLVVQCDQPFEADREQSICSMNPPGCRNTFQILQSVWAARHRRRQRI